METMDLIKDITKSAADKKAARVVVQDLKSKSSICDYQIICSATNEKQCQAICQNIEESLKKKYKLRAVAIEGRQTGHWILMDYSDVIVHIFIDEIRDYYALEEIWPDARLLPMDQ